MTKVATFDDWIDLFRQWQRDIGFDSTSIPDYAFNAIYEDPPSLEVEFGEFAGVKKWERILEVPTQEMRDALLHLIVYPGDTEFASSEQQRHLVRTAPTSYDLQCLLRVMGEEMRHGWQMSHLLVTHFGLDHSAVRLFFHGGRGSDDDSLPGVLYQSGGADDGPSS